MIPFRTGLAERRTGRARIGRPESCGGSRGRRAAWIGGLAIAVASACAPADDRPAGEPYPGGPEARVVEPGEVPLIEHAAPAESLHVRAGPPPRAATLVLFRGRGVARDSSGHAYVIDPGGSRILVIDPGLRVRRTVGGPAEEDGAIARPLSVAVTPGGGAFLADAEHPRGLLYYQPSGRFGGAARPPVANPELAAGPDGALWGARSPYLLGFDAPGPGDPLVVRFDPLSGEGIGIAEVEPLPAAGARLAEAGGNEEAVWQRLAGAGAVAVAPDGRGAFAFLLRNELRGYDADGTLRWRSRRALPEAAELRPLTQALAVGPDGLIYALTADLEPPGAAAGGIGPSGVRRLEAWDPADGSLRRATIVPVAWTSFAVDREGRVYGVDPARVQATAPPPERRPLPSVALRGFDGDTTSFAAYRGRALLVNFWASWCAPCREELPQLKAYYGTLDRERVEFLAISEDTDTAAARRFAADFDLPFPLFFGEGRMRRHFHYLGLPYTLIVDARGRIVEEIYGFGSERTWTHLTSTLEREMERVGGGAPAVDGQGPHRHGRGEGH